MRFIVLVFLSCAAAWSAAGFAYDAEKTFPATTPPRVLSLFPDELFIPGVEPALPTTFIARKAPSPFDPRVYWGEPESLKYYFKKKATQADKPVIALRISENMNQKELTEEEVRKVIEEDFPKRGYKNVRVEFLQWGQYPVVAMENKVKDDIILMAWVGMNMPTGETLLLSYLYPEGKDHPTQMERSLWNTLLHETKELPEQLYFISQGQDMHAGYTIVTKGPVKMLVIAEKRKSDGKTLLAIEPLNRETQFILKGVEEGQLMSKWNQGAPMLKVSGIITAKHSVYDHTTGVIIREVDEFSVDPEELRLKHNVVISDGQ